jgi:hypothetical protein
MVSITDKVIGVVVTLSLLLIIIGLAMVSSDSTKTGETYVLPSLMDIQEKLNELEPSSPIEADGKWGPETKEKWERVWCNEQAKKYFKGTN